MRRANLNGTYEVHTNAQHYPAILQPTHARIEQVVDQDEQEASSDSTSFVPLKPAIARNFLVVDTIMETPPTGVSPASYSVPFRTSRGDYEASAQADFLSSFQGLSAVSQEIRDLLPEDCRKAFDEAATKEEEWASKWGDEATSTCRREPIADKAIVPYSMM
jgi:chromatin structure-remodeling complex protein RSC7